MFLAFLALLAATLAAAPLYAQPMPECVSSASNSTPSQEKAPGQECGMRACCMALPIADADLFHRAAMPASRPAFPAAFSRAPRGLGPVVEPPPPRLTA